MNRTGALVVVALGLWCLGVGARVRGPARAPALDCAPHEVHRVEGLARCGAGEPLSAAQRRLLGQKLDLNGISEQDLARVPGVGAALARELVRTRGRRGAFASWDEVAAVSGVGSSRLATLRAVMELR